MLNTNQIDKIAVLTINRPLRRNALCPELRQTLKTTLSLLDRDPGVHSIVLTGAAPGFCAGSDLKMLGTMTPAEKDEDGIETAALLRSITQFATPIIAAVDGFAMGGGFMLAIACDLVVSSANCRWQLPEVSLGWLPAYGLQMLAARVGPVLARRVTWGLDPIDGREACRLGVADYLSEDVVALDCAIAVARRIADLPPTAVATTKRYFSGQISGSAEAGDAEANRLFLENCRDENAIATLSRLSAKR